MRGLPQAPGDISVASLILLTAAPWGRGTSASQHCYAGVASVLPPPEVELTHTHTDTHTYRQTERKTDKQTDRQTHRHTDRQTDRQIIRQTD